jgi:hypothetical protein
MTVKHKIPGPHENDGKQNTTIIVEDIPQT